MKFRSKIKDGKLILFNRKLFDNYLLNLEDKHVDLSVKLPSKDRSNNQNRYYWGIVVDIIGKELGYTADETHEALKMKFLLDRRGKIPTVRSTTVLSTKEFEDYLEDIKRWAAEFLNVVLPDPNPQEEGNE